MKLRQINWLGLLLTAVALSGCDTGRQAPGKTVVRIANVAPSFGELQFRREQNDQPAFLPFKGATETSYDADTYDFFVEERSFITDRDGQLHTWAQTIDASLLYTFVLTERAGILEHVVLEHTGLPLDTTDAQLVGVNAAAGPAIDVYFERPGVGIAGATPRASGAFLEPWTPTRMANGEYELWLTEAGNPANVLLATSTLVLAGGATTTFIVVPEAGASSEELSVLMIQASPIVLYDRNAAAGLRVINAAADTLPRDFVINNQFSSPLFSAIPFAEPTAYATIPAAGAQPIHVTPGGYPAVLELSSAISTTQGQLSTVLVTGEAGVLTHAVSIDDNRRIAGEAKLRFFHAANQFATPIDFVVVPPGGDLTTAFPLSVLFTPGISAQNSLAPGTYDLGLRTNGTTTILAGPISITVADGGVYGALAVNGPDTATATIVLFDDFL